MLATVRRITETVGNAEFGIDGEQQRQSAWRLRIDGFLDTGVTPRPPQTDVIGLPAAERHSGRVMHIRAECLFAELLIVAGIKNELVP